MTIKYLVLSGGGHSGCTTYGALKYLADKQFWNIQNIEAIYGTSIGSIIGVILILNYEWEFLDNYIIKRPWKKLINIEPENLFNIYNEKGFLDINIVAETIIPLLEAKGFSKNVTLKEFNAKTNIDLHVFACDMNQSNSVTPVNISHKTFPDMPLIKAVMASSAIPFILTPVFEKEYCLIDGGILYNYPLDFCLEETKCKPTEIMAIKNLWEPAKNIITPETTIVDYTLLFIRKLHSIIEKTHSQTDVPYCIDCYIDNSINNTNTYISFIYDESVRKMLIDNGIKLAKEFYESIEKS